MKLNGLQLKILFGSILIIIVGIGITLYYLKSMKTINGDININKIKSVDKVYSYTIFSDFYFHVEKFDEDRELIANYSKIIPLETDIGYDFANLNNSTKIDVNPDIVMSTRVRLGEIDLIDDNGVKVGDVIDALQKYAKKYGELVSVQDQHYFDAVALSTQKTLNDLYKIEKEIKPKNISEYRESLIESPIENLKIQPYKLKRINKNLKKFESCKLDWCPNLAKWEFGEEDKILFQYIVHFKKEDLNDYLKKTNKKNATIINLTKINNNKVEKFFMKISPNNKIESFFMDDNGYIYSLLYKAKNSKSFDKYLDDYLSIAFGIEFKDVKNFNNKYADLKVKMQKSDKSIQEYVKSIVKLDNQLNKNNFYEHFGLKVNQISYKCCQRALPYDERFEEYLNLHHKYDISEIILTELNNKELLEEAIDNKSGFMTSTDEAMEIIKGQCKSIECLQELKNNDWKE